MSVYLLISCVYYSGCRGDWNYPND